MMIIIIIIMSSATVVIIHCSITNNVAIHSHIFKDGDIQLAVGDPSFHETLAGLELQLPSVKNLWNIKHGLRFCARLWKNYWRHQRKQRCWTSFVALVLKGYNFQRFVQLAASVCFFVCAFWSIVEEKYEWCQFAGQFFSSHFSSYITTTTTTATTTTTTAAAVVTITIMVHGSTLG